MTKKNNKKNKTSYNRIVIKLLLSFVYISIIGVLVYSAYTIFTEEKKIVKWTDVEKTNQYTYLEIDQMSEAFAKMDNKQIHFVMEKEKTGAWYTYLIAIDEKDYDKYKPIIDYTYERTKTKPQTIKIYGYPIKVTKKIKSLAIKNITKFVPVENEIVIDNSNFEKYLTNTYLDTTIEKIEKFNYYVLILLLGALVIFIIFVYTIFEKDKQVKKGSKSVKKQHKNKKKDTKKDDKKVETKTKQQKQEKKIEDKKETNKQVKKQDVKEPSKSSKNTTNNETKKNVQNKSTTNKKTQNKNSIKENDDIEII